MAEALEHYLELQKVKHLKSSAFHPRINGLVENLNKFIKRMLSKYVGDFPTRWDAFLQQIIFTCRVRTHSATKQSPFKLVYGIEPIIPGDTTNPYLFDETDSEEMLEYRVKELESLGQLRAAALERAYLNVTRMKKQFDINVHSQDYKIGEYVWMKKMKCGALEPKFEGPFQILNVCPLGTFQLLKQNGDIKQDLVHKDRLKLANLGENEKNLFTERAKFLIRRTKEIFNES